MDWLASILELSGLYFNGNKKRYCFIFSGIGCCLWIFVSIDKEVYGLLLVVVPALVLNVINWRKWKSNE